MSTLLRLLVGFSVVLTCIGCTHSQPAGCPTPPLSKSELIKIVNEELGRVSIDRSRLSIKVTRDECNYLYRETLLPKMPGGYIVLVISPEGRVLEVIHGL